MTTRTGRAGGKVILFGEHAVVYGVPAIAVGIERGAFASATPLASGPSTLRSPTWNITVSEDEPDVPLARALHDVLDVTRAGGVAIGPVAVEVTADLPPGGGLGCSAALGVAIARALDPEAAPEVIADRAGAWERTFHGNPSGVDAAVSALGGCVLFKRGAGGAGATIERIRATGTLHLCVGNTGHPSSTRLMVEGLAQLCARRPDTTRKAFDAIDSVVRSARLAIEAGDRAAVGQLLDRNQVLLAELSLSTPAIEKMCAAARAAGALGAKLTGGGGGGCVIALADGPEVGARVLAAWKAVGFDGFLTTVGAEVPRRSVAPKLEAEAE